MESLNKGHIGIRSTVTCSTVEPLNIGLGHLYKNILNNMTLETVFKCFPCNLFLLYPFKEVMVTRHRLKRLY